jgi:signal transduction histidine kinase/CheY-like chemotaxis protein
LRFKGCPGETLTVASVPVSGRWRHWLTPPVAITDVAERQSVQLVSLLLVLILSCSVGGIAIASIGATDWVLARLPVLLSLLASYVALFALNRTRHHRVAAFVFCLGPLWSNLPVGLYAPDDPIWYAFVPAATILSSALIGFRAALVISAIGAASTVAVVTIRHDAYGGRGIILVGYVTLVSAIVLGMAYYRDEVERARLAEVERLAQQLAATERMESVGRLAGGMAHDFNNLLTVILASADLARQGRSAPERLDDIKDAAERAAMLTRQLLAFTRNRASAKAIVRLDDLVRDVQPLLRRLIPENIELDLELDSDWAVEADDSQLQQVVLNLVANARDAMPNGGRLCIATARVSGSSVPVDPLAGDRVLLTIADTGSGMDEATRRHALEPFFTTKPIGQGTGLGLATVHGIVRQSGGTVVLASELGSGTTVTIALPRSSKQPTATVEAKTVVTPRATGVVLVVEDDPHVRASTAQILRELGLSVVVAASAAEVPRALREAPAPIDMLVSDVVLPGQSGPSLAAELRAAHPDLAVVLMSGYSEQDVAMVAAQPNTRFVAKPFTVDALTSAVLDLLARRTVTVRNAPRAS